MFDMNTVKPIVEGMKWLVTLTAAEIKNVKDETQQLLGHLSASLIGLWEVTKEVSKLSDQDFKTGFPAVYEYFKKFYYDPKAFEQVRTHCSDLKRDEGRISFKLSKFLRTDIGKWKDANQKLQFSLLEDASYIVDYQQNFELLNTRLNEIHGLL